AKATFATLKVAKVAFATLAAVSSEGGEEAFTDSRGLDAGGVRVFEHRTRVIEDRSRVIEGGTHENGFSVRATGSTVCRSRRTG
ncbi:hypothetical protein, partial [Amycolatopsis thailandensis]|uniref:hypothetical protein n=1 Tax=Amycolatopsis thailandensis TaxID=589330 RepID=UPI00363F5766